MKELRKSLVRPLHFIAPFVVIGLVYLGYSLGQLINEFEFEEAIDIATSDPSAIKWLLIALSIGALIEIVWIFVLLLIRSE